MRRCMLVVVVVQVLGLVAFAENSGLNLGAFDRSMRVQDDLFLAVNGSWLSDTEIPADKSDYGSFGILADLSQQRIRQIIEEAAVGEHQPGTGPQQVGDLYKSFMDEDRIERLGIQPMQDELARIDEIQNHQDVVKYFGYAQRLGFRTPVAMFVTQDDKDSTRYIVAVVQSGTSLPDRDYYLEEDERYEKAQLALANYVNKVFELSGQATDQVGADILALETKLAEVQWPRVELRDANKRYNLHSFDELKEMGENISPVDFFLAAGIPDPGDVNVMTPSFFEGLDALVTATPVETWKNYLRYQVFDRAAPWLPREFVQAHFDFHERELAGVPELKPRWKRAVEAIAGEGAGDFGALGDVVGEMYVERHFSLVAKARMEELVANLLRAYETSIDQLSWMTDVTKAKAQEKLSKFRTKIGYTNKWRDYSSLVIKPDDLFGNMKRSAAVEYQRMIDKLGKPIDREEWGMTPQTVNAYYNPGKNEIVFPAAILQPPFFNELADDAVNYGGIGAVIGHEISHGFDDQGSKYDGNGNLKNWWTERDRAAFKQLTEQLVDQYNEYAPLPGRTVNGQLTLGENIADLSGLSIAHKAYELSLGGSDPPEIDGWTGDQRFFLGWSQVWRRKYRDAEMIRRLKTDPHAPSWYRANGPVINIDAFYTAFGVEPGDAMYRAPEQRIYIW